MLHGETRRAPKQNSTLFSASHKIHYHQLRTSVDSWGALEKLEQVWVEKGINCNKKKHQKEQAVCWYFQTC